MALENLEDPMAFFELTHPGIATRVEDIRESLPEYTWCVDILDSPNHVWPDYIHPTLICVYAWRLMNLDYCPHHEFLDSNPGPLPRLVLEKYFQLMHLTHVETLILKSIGLCEEDDPLF